MSMTIGRASLTTDPLRNSVSIDGDTLRFSASLGATSVDDCKAKMQQLAGLVDNRDEDVFPFTCTGDSSFDGFYRVTGLAIEPLDRYLTLGQCRFSIAMERIGGGFARPQFESIVQQIVRTNSHGVTAPAGFDLSWYAGTSTEADVAYSGIWSFTHSEGAHKWHTGFAPSGPSTYLIATKPADYYLNSARIEVKYGSTWYPVHGQQVPLGTGVNWRIANGITRLYPTSVSGNGRFTVEGWRSGDGWQGVEYGLIASASVFVNATGTTSDPSSLKIVKNTPEIVVVRTRQQAEEGAVIDWTLRKGDYHVEINIYQPDGASANNWGVRMSTVTASTAATAGTLRSSGTTASRYQQIMCPSTVTADTVNGSLRLTSATSTAVFAVAPDADLGIGTAASVLRDVFFAARSERVRVVTR